MKTIAAILLIMVAGPFAHGEPRLISANHKGFVRIRDEAKNTIRECFVRLNRIVSIEIRNSALDDSPPFELRICTSALRGTSRGVGKPYYPDNLEYDIVFDTREEAVAAADRIMESIQSLENEK